MEEFCELCGKRDSSVSRVIIHEDSDPDVTLHDETLVCIHCQSKYVSDMVMFLVIYQKRMKRAENEGELDI